MTQTHQRPSLAGIGPLPQADPLTEPFWNACREGRLVLQSCSDCGQYQHPPEFLCHHCLSEHMGWQEVADTGTIYSLINVTHPVYPGTDKLLPYNVVIVEVDGCGIRLFGNVLGARFDELSLGAPVRLCPDPVADDVTLPRWMLRHV